MKSRVPAISLVVLLFVVNALGQISSMHGSTMLSVSGTVLTADGHPVRDARVEVHDLLNGSEITSAYTLPSGSFTITNLPNGHYELRVTSGLQEARERLDLDRVNQQVTLRVSQAGETGGPATISVVEMKVPSKAKKEYEKAEEAFGKRRLDEARSHCDKALEAAPTYSRALSLSALLNLTNNKLEDAAKQAEQAVKSDYGYAMGYVVLGAIYNAMQRYDDAIRTLDRGIPLAPSSWQANFELSKALLGKGDYQRALASADRAIPVAPPDYAPLHLVRAHALLALKAYQDAMVELEKCIGGDPNSTSTAEARKTLDQVKAFVATSKK